MSDDPRPTRRQLEALSDAAKGQLRRPTTHHAARIADALWQNDWITWQHGNTFPGRARLTDAGTAILETELARTTRHHLDRPRWLAPCNRPLTQGDYTRDPRRALIDAGEVLDDRAQRRISATARRRDRDRALERRRQRQRDRELLTVEDRLAAAMREARLREIDVSGESWLVRQMLGKGRATAAIGRLRRIENQLDQAA